MIWVAVKKLFVLYSSVWIFDRGKLVIRCFSQVTKVVKGTMNDLGELTTHSAVASSFKQIFQVSHCYASIEKMCVALRISFEEREEELIPMGMVTLTFC